MREFDASAPNRVWVTELALAALQAALAARHRPAGLVHHSDRRSPCASEDYRTALSRHGLVASMSRKGD
jgi:putative transposase